MVIGLAHKHGKALRALNRQGFENALMALEDGDYLVSLTKKKPLRSIKANRRYFAIVTMAAMQLGSVADKADVHEGLRFKLLPLPPLFPGVPRARSTADLDTAEFADYVANAEAYLATEHGVDFTDWERYV
jgi:hypothetical protein